MKVSRKAQNRQMVFFSHQMSNVKRRNRLSKQSSQQKVNSTLDANNAKHSMVKEVKVDYKASQALKNEIAGQHKAKNYTKKLEDLKKREKENTAKLDKMRKEKYKNQAAQKSNETDRFLDKKNHGRPMPKHNKNLKGKSLAKSCEKKPSVENPVKP